MTKNGFWVVDVADIKLSQCEVGFGDKGQLEVVTPAGIFAKEIERLKLMPGRSGQRFSIKIEKQSLIAAMFHKCHLVGYDEGGISSEEHTQFFSPNRSKPSTPSMVFRFQYETEKEALNYHHS